MMSHLNSSNEERERVTVVNRGSPRDVGTPLTSSQAHILLRAAFRVSTAMGQGLEGETHSVPADSSDDGLPELSHLGPVTQEVLLVDIGELLVLHLLDIGTRCERLVASRDDDSSDGIVAGNGVESRVQFVEESRVEGCEGWRVSCGSGS